MTLPTSGDLVAGRYRVERVVGRGGMGIVFAAKHELLNQSVALKILTSVADDEATSRFVNEARVAAQIKSEHVCRVLDAGALPCGRRFMVMDLLVGMDLEGVLGARGPMPIGRTVAYVLQALEALAEAHALDIVHRDLKPSNFFLCERRSGDAVIKLLDFGISKCSSVGVVDKNMLALTASGTIMGSPSYMSPEQVRDSSRVDVRSDVWSIGIVLYELLTGACPFRGKTAGEIFHRMLIQRPDPLRVGRPDVPPALDDIVLRCLTRDRARRFQDVHALAIALAPFADVSEEARWAHVERIRMVLGKDPACSLTPPLPARAPVPAPAPAPAPPPHSGFDAVTIIAAARSTASWALPKHSIAPWLMAFASLMALCVCAVIASISADSKSKAATAAQSRPIISTPTSIAFAVSATAPAVATLPPASSAIGPPAPQAAPLDEPSNPARVSPRREVTMTPATTKRPSRSSVDDEDVLDRRH